MLARQGPRHHEQEVREPVQVHAPEDITRLLAEARRMPGQLLIGARSRDARRRTPLRGRARYYANRFADLWTSWAAGHPIVDSLSRLRYEALRLSRELLADWTRVLGADHPETLTTRGNIAAFTGETGEAREALRLFLELLPDLTRVLGADYPETLRTRGHIAARTAETGEAREALRLFRELLPDRTRVLGADHPETLRTRGNIAARTGETGEAHEALRLFRDLLPDQTRVLGADHPDTINTQGWINFLQRR